MTKKLTKEARERATQPRVVVYITPKLPATQTSSAEITAGSDA